MTSDLSFINFIIFVMIHTKAKLNSCNNACIFSHSKYFQCQNILFAFSLFVSGNVNPTVDDFSFQDFFQQPSEFSVLDFQKKYWGQLAPKFSFFVARTSILVTKNYI